MVIVLKSAFAPRLFLASRLRFLSSRALTFSAAHTVFNLQCLHISLSDFLRFSFCLIGFACAAFVAWLLILGALALWLAVAAVAVLAGCSCCSSIGWL